MMYFYTIIYIYIYRLHCFLILSRAFECYGFCSSCYQYTRCRTCIIPNVPESFSMYKGVHKNLKRRGAPGRSTFSLCKSWVIAARKPGTIDRNGLPRPTVQILSFILFSSLRKASAKSSNQLRHFYFLILKLRVTWPQSKQKKDSYR